MFLNYDTIIADYHGLLRLSQETWTNVLGEEEFVWLGNDNHSNAPSSNQLRLDYRLQCSLNIHALIEEFAEHEGDELRVGQGAFVRVPLRVQFLGQLFVIGDKAIMEDSHSLLLVEDWVGLRVTHGVLPRGVPRVKYCDAASRLSRF